MQNYQHDSNSHGDLNQNNMNNNPYTQGQNINHFGYDPNSIEPSHNKNSKQTKKSAWGYVLTSALSIILTIVLMLTLFMSLNLDKLVPVSAFENNQRIPRYDDIESNILFDNTEENRAALEKLNILIQLVKDNYYVELSDQDILDSMMKGMTDNLGSPYTFYMTPEYVQESKESMAASYSGIGATIEKISDYYQVSDIVEDSPADQAGLMINDMFVSVDGKDATEYEDVSSVAMDVKGEEGTSVEIKVFRPSDNKEYTFNIVRKTISNSNIHSRMLNDELGYVRIVSFSEDVSVNFIEAVDRLQAEGAKNIVFDLRNNGGGYVHEVLAMLDYLLPEGKLITEIGRRDGEDYELEEHSDAEMGVAEDMRYICLMNGNSASASELFAGCLRDWEKAELVGETSFGKGVGSITKYLNDGSAVQITNFYYNLPNGENINDIGLEPDYEVELPEDIQNVIVSRIPEGEDLQLEKAIEILSK